MKRKVKEEDKKICKTEYNNKEIAWLESGYGVFGDQALVKRWKDGTGDKRTRIRRHMEGIRRKVM